MLTKILVYLLVPDQHHSFPSQKSLSCIREPIKWYSTTMYNSQKKSAGLEESSTMSTPQLRMEHYGLFRSIRMHLLPGLLVVVLYIILAPVVNRYGYPSMLALTLAAFVVIVPLQLGHLFYKGYQLNGKLSLEGVIKPTQRMSASKFAGWLLASMVILIVIGAITFTFESKIKSSLFSWLPAWYFYDSNFQSYSKHALFVTAWIRLILDGIIFPVTEELYFRGYLFPRLPGTIRYKWTLGAVLFAIYHFWQPWNYISLFFISLVLIAPVTKLNNVYLSIAIHMCANLIGGFLFFGQIASI
jgi:membrane protease YdiL (CAAX protease family)